MRLLVRIGHPILMAAIALLAGCAGQPLIQNPATKGDLRGMVYDLDRQPVPDASVSLLGRDPASAVLTDLHGRFALGIQPYGKARLKIAKTGVEPLEWEFEFKPGAEVLYLQLATADQLFERASLALEKKAWLEFQGFLDRGLALDAASLQGLMLQSIAFEQKGALSDAIAVLESRSFTPPVFAVEVLLGDLYETARDHKAALVHWQNALAIKEDSGVRKKVGVKTD